MTLDVDRLIEPVARAMAEIELRMGDPDYEVQQRVDDQWPLYSDLARAAIRAMSAAEQKGASLTQDQGTDGGGA